MVSGFGKPTGNRRWTRVVQVDGPISSPARGLFSRSERPAWGPWEAQAQADYATPTVGSGKTGGRFGAGIGRIQHPHKSKLGATKQGVPSSGSQSKNFKRKRCGALAMDLVPGDLVEDRMCCGRCAWGRSSAVLPEMRGSAPGKTGKVRARRGRWMCESTSVGLFCL